jgi:hypothetical protein
MGDAIFWVGERTLPQQLQSPESCLPVQFGDLFLWLFLYPPIHTSLLLIQKNHFVLSLS